MGRMPSYSATPHGSLTVSEITDVPQQLLRSSVRRCRSLAPVIRQ